MKNWLRFYSIPIVRGLLITVPVVGILTFALKATDEATKQEVPTAKYVIWPAGILFRQHLTDSYEVDNHGFLVFVDIERGVEVKMPISRVHLIEPVQ